MGSICQSYDKDILSEYSVESIKVPDSLQVDSFPILVSPPESVYESLFDLSLPSWSHGNSLRSTPKADEHALSPFIPTCDCSPDLKEPTLKVPKRLF